MLCPVQEDTPGPLAPDFSGGTLKFRATGDEYAGGGVPKTTLPSAARWATPAARATEPAGVKADADGTEEAGAAASERGTGGPPAARRCRAGSGGEAGGAPVPCPGAATVRCSAAGTDGVTVAIDAVPSPPAVQRTGTASAGDAPPGPEPGTVPVPVGEGGADPSGPSTAERCTAAPDSPLRTFWSGTGRSASSGATGSVLGGGARGAGDGTAEVRSVPLPSPRSLPPSVPVQRVVPGDASAMTSAGESAVAELPVRQLVG
ncbi:hypothetical protein EAO76_43035, partial [Streptomyces sp. sk2.1]